MKRGDPVLVVGAAGFVGTAAVRALRAAGHQVGAGVRRAEKDGTVFADVLDPSSLASACRNKTTVVHCAVGPPGDTRVIVEGTCNLIAAAQDAQVSHLIYLSSVAVYEEREGSIGEDSVTDRPHGTYGEAKRVAEALCFDAVRPGFAVTILRPSLIYGPDSAQWTTLFVDRLRTRRWRALGAGGEGTCNLIHVDDLADFIVNRVQAGPSGLAVFNVNGADLPTWNSYIERLNAALALPSLPPPGRLAGGLRWLARRPLRTAASLLRRAGKRGWAASIENRILAIPSRDEITRFSTNCRYDISRLRQSGFTPRRSVDDGVREIAEHVRRQANISEAGETSFDAECSGGSARRTDPVGARLP